MRSALLLAGLCAATLNGPPARADAGCPAGINKLRYDDDIACFRDPTDRESPLDALKFVPLDEMGEIYLSLGGEIRQRYEYTHYPAFGEDPQEDRKSTRLELQSLMRISYAVFCLKKKKTSPYEIIKFIYDI